MTTSCPLRFPFFPLEERGNSETFETKESLVWLRGWFPSRFFFYGATWYLPRSSRGRRIEEFHKDAACQNYQETVSQRFGYACPSPTLKYVFVEWYFWTKASKRHHRGSIRKFAAVSLSLSFSLSLFLLSVHVQEASGDRAYLSFPSFRRWVRQSKFASPYRVVSLCSSKFSFFYVQREKKKKYSKRCVLSFPLPLYVRFSRGPVGHLSRFQKNEKTAWTYYSTVPEASAVVDRSTARSPLFLLLFIVFLYFFLLSLVLFLVGVNRPVFSLSPDEKRKDAQRRFTDVVWSSNLK